jgi:hypothetical protein
MGTIIAKNVIIRKPGFLYYINANGDVCESKMSRGGRKKGSGKKKPKKVITKKKSKSKK